jgi:hypothetical protein
VPYTGNPQYFTFITGNPLACCVITGKTTNVTYPTGRTGYYMSMSSILSGGTNGTSLLTGLTIPILFRETAVDIGYYSVFDGAILQADVVKNFVFSANTNFPYTYSFYNTSETYLNFLSLSNYTVDWGDTVVEPITTTSPNFISHTYGAPGSYLITLKQTNPWGISVVKKQIVVPFTATTIDNPNGTAYFISNVGSWSATPISYDFIFSGDAENIVSAQTSDNYVVTPFNVSGYTSSRVTELKQYGTIPYITGLPIYKDGLPWGMITTMTPSFTGYTIEGVQYYDYDDGVTTYGFASSGLIKDWLVAEPIVKNESLMNLAYEPEVQSDIFIERGKNSALERVERLGEIDNIGDLENYGYGFFNFVNQSNF